MALPFAGGATQVIDACALPDVAVTVVGAPGAPTGVTAADAPAGPADTPLLAVTENVYAVPSVRPTTVIVVVEAPAVSGASAVEPWYGVTVYEVIGTPPFDAGAAHDTAAWP